jgi:hypothetical protein
MLLLDKNWPAACGYLAQDFCVWAGGGSGKVNKPFLLISNARQVSQGLTFLSSSCSDYLAT